MWGCIQRCMSFEKGFHLFLKVVFESVVRCGFKNRQVFCFERLIQVTKRLSTLKFSQRFLLCFKPFDNFVPPLHLVDNLVLEGERDRRGSSFRP